MDQFILALLFTVIDIYVVLLFIRVFSRASERFDAVFGMIFRATDPVVEPLTPAMRWRQFNLAPLVVIAALIIVKGLLLGSIPVALLRLADRLFQLYVLIIIIIAGFREYYINPIASFGQRMVNPIRAVAAQFSRSVVAVNLLSVVILIVLHAVVTLILVQLIGGTPANLFKATIIRSLLKIVDLTTFFTYVVIIDAILSWVSPDPLNPIVQLINLISMPIVEPIRRYVPPIGGMFDISPIIAIFGLQILHSFGYSLLTAL
jgi:YggT family protein